MPFVPIDNSWKTVLLNSDKGWNGHFARNGEVYLGSVNGAKIYKAPAGATDFNAAAVVFADGTSLGFQWIKPILHSAHLAASDVDPRRPGIWVAGQVPNDLTAFTGLRAAGQAMPAATDVTAMEIRGTQTSLDVAGIVPTGTGPVDPGSPSPALPVVYVVPLAGGSFTAAHRLFSGDEVGGLIGKQLGVTNVRWSPDAVLYRHTSGSQGIVTVPEATREFGFTNRVTLSARAFTTTSRPKVASPIGQNFHSPLFRHPQAHLSSGVTLHPNYDADRYNEGASFFVWTVATFTNGIGEAAGIYAKDSIGTAVKGVGLHDMDPTNSFAVNRRLRMVLAEDAADRDLRTHLLKDWATGFIDYHFVPPNIGGNRFTAGGGFTQNSLGPLATRPVHRVGIGSTTPMPLAESYGVFRGLFKTPLGVPRLFRLAGATPVTFGGFRNVSATYVCDFIPIPPKDGTLLPNVIDAMGMDLNGRIYVAAHHQPVVTLTDPITGQSFEDFDYAAESISPGIWWWDHVGELGSPQPGRAVRLMALDYIPASLDFVGNDAKGPMFMAPTINGNSNLISVESNEPAVLNSEPLRFRSLFVNAPDPLISSPFFGLSIYNLGGFGPIYGSFENSPLSTIVEGTQRSVQFGSTTYPSTPDKVRLVLAVNGVIGNQVGRSFLAEFSVIDPETGIPSPFGTASVNTDFMMEDWLGTFATGIDTNRGVYDRLFSGPPKATPGSFVSIFLGPQTPNKIINCFWNARHDVGPVRRRIILRFGGVNPDTGLPAFKNPFMATYQFMVDLRPVRLQSVISNEFADEQDLWGIKISGISPATAVLNTLTDLRIVGGNFLQTTLLETKVSPTVPDPFTNIPGPLINILVFRKELDDVSLPFNIVVANKTDAGGRPPYWEFDQSSADTGILVRGLKFPVRGKIRVLALRKGLVPRNPAFVLDTPKKAGLPIPVIVAASELGALRVL